MTREGFEPPTSGFGIQRATNCAIKPCQNLALEIYNRNQY